MDKFNADKLKRTLAATLELPKDIILDLPMITLTGNERINITNHKGLAGYNQTTARIKTSIGIAQISGLGLIIKEIGRENIIIEGKIEMVEYICS